MADVGLIAVGPGVSDSGAGGPPTLSSSCEEECLSRSSLHFQDWYGLEWWGAARIGLTHLLGVGMGWEGVGNTRIIREGRTPPLGGTVLAGGVGKGI